MAWTPHTYVTFGGTVGAATFTDEIWQCGVRGADIHGSASGAPLSPAHAAEYATDLAETATSTLPQWFQAAHSLIPTTAHLKWLKVASIGPDGKYTDAPELRSMDVTGTATARVPMFMSVALSFQTAVAFGHKLKYGRVYPPNTGCKFITGESAIDPSDQTSLMASALDLIQTLAINSTDYAFEPRIYSREGGYSAITRVRIGNLYDVQRRRKNAVRETYVGEPITT